MVELRGSYRDKDGTFEWIVEPDGSINHRQFRAGSASGVEILDPIPQKFKTRAFSLSPLGLHELAWTREDALEILQDSEAKSVAILGGDVYRMSGDVIRPARENWFCEPLRGESLEDFRRRSRQQAIDYISSFPQQEQVMFSLVLTSEMPL